MDITLVVPAAGRGTRFPYINDVPKGMIPVCGKPLLEYALRAGLDLPINRIVIVISPAGSVIRDHFGGSFNGIPIHYVTQAEPRGLVDAVSMAEPYVSDWLVVINGDEIFTHCRHRDIMYFVQENQATGVVGYLHTDEPRRIQIGYGMTLAADGRVETLIEKPKTTWNDILGVGTWLHRADFFDYFRRTPVDPVRKEKDFVRVVQLMVDDGQRIFGFDLAGEFFNLNTPADLEKAEAALGGRVAVFNAAG